ncbi:MAG: type II secretion system protein C [Sphingopyxis sp.]|nr:type II secretion system protein C [Sphingopyxis sp.]
MAGAVSIKWLRTADLRWPHVLAALLAALVLVQVVRLLWATAVPPGPLGAWRHGGAQLVAASEGRTLFAAFDPFFRSAPAASASATVTALDLTLFGVNVNEAAGTGSAIIAAADGVQSSFAIGDEVQPGVTLAAVAFDHVVLDRSGARETLFIDQSVPATAAAPAVAGSASAAPAPVSDANGGDELSPQALQNGVGFAPRAEDGRVTGLVVQPRGDGAVFRAAGLRPGDVVRAVNGRPIGSAADLSAQLAPGARLSLEVERGGAVVPIALFIGKQ